MYSPGCRKVAVPVPDGYTWAEFTQQVMAKLKIAGIKDIFLAAVCAWALAPLQTGWRGLPFWVYLS
jgi:hypothetical protein